jgi:hypothetical protein
MMRRFEPKGACHFILKDLDLLRKEFDDLATLGTDHVIVVVVVEMMFVISAIVAETDLSCQTGLHQQLQRTVDGRQADTGVLFADQKIQIFACDMTLCSQERKQDGFTLVRASKAGGLDVLIENI